MFRIIIVKQLPKKPLLALVVLALAVMAGVGGAAEADAQVLKPRTYTIEVSFDSISFPRLDDCPILFSRCDTADLNGAFTASTTDRNSFGWVEASRQDSINCIQAWTATAPQACLRHVTQGQTVSLASVALACFQSTTPGFPCNATYGANNNKIRLTVRPGDFITLDVFLQDVDGLTFEDDVCVTQRQVGPFPTRSQISTSFVQTVTLSQAFNGDGSCNVSATLRRVS